MEERPAESCLEQLGTHLAHDGGWFRIQQPGDVIELFSTDAPVSLAVSSAGGRTTQPYDGGPGNLLRTKAAREQLFEDVENWRPRLFVVYLTDWTPEVSELVLELVRRQRADGRDLLLRYPIHTTIPLPLGHTGMGLHMVYGTLEGRRVDTSQRTPRFWWAATTRTLATRLSECVQREASVSHTLVSFLHLDGKSGDEVKGPSLCSRGRAYIRTYPGPDWKITRRHQVGSK